jgi:hypothetical protein
MVGPGSFIEVSKIIGPLTEGKDRVRFHAVAPSLPSFNFSLRPEKTDF